MAKDAAFNSAVKQTILIAIIYTILHYAEGQGFISLKLFLLIDKGFFIALGLVGLKYLLFR